MKYMELIAPCHFGMEAVLKREILDLGYEISKVEDGKVTFLADAEGIAQANMFLRTTSEPGCPWLRCQQPSEQPCSRSQH